jgi:Zn-finger nucleic acid-binding protein
MPTEAGVMLCPVCSNVDMFVLEYELVEVDYCPKCHGVWLDSGELVLIGHRAGALHAEFLAALEEQKGERRTEGAPRRCPVCRKRLRAVKTQTAHPIVIDRCPRGDGLWFDEGELAAVVTAAGGDEANVLARFFAELGGPSKDKGNL